VITRLAVRARTVKERKNLLLRKLVKNILLPLNKYLGEMGHVPETEDASRGRYMGTDRS
jgi:hypothetical protein